MFSIPLPKGLSNDRYFRRRSGFISHVSGHRVTERILLTIETVVSLWDPHTQIPRTNPMSKPPCKKIRAQIPMWKPPCAYLGCQRLPPSGQQPQADLPMQQSPMQISHALAWAAKDFRLSGNNPRLTSPACTRGGLSCVCWDNDLFHQQHLEGGHDTKGRGTLAAQQIETAEGVGTPLGRFKGF